MKNKKIIKKIINELESFKADAKTTHLYEDDNTATIIININDNIYQNFSGNNMLTDEIYSFIENTFKLIDNKKKKIILKFIFDDSYDENEKNHILSLIKMHYALEFKEKKKEIKRNNIIGFILLSIGALIMSIYGILCYFNNNFVFREIIGIFSWVFLWEACDYFFFKNSTNRFMLLQYLILWECKKEIQS